MDRTDHRVRLTRIGHLVPTPGPNPHQAKVVYPHRHKSRYGHGPPSSEKAREVVDAFEAVNGADPLLYEEHTGEQPEALETIVRSGRVPYADLLVFEPWGKPAARHEMRWMGIGRP